MPGKKLKLKVSRKPSVKHAPDRSVSALQQSEAPEKRVKIATTDTDIAKLEKRRQRLAALKQKGKFQNKRDVTNEVDPLDAYMTNLGVSSSTNQSITFDEIFSKSSDTSDSKASSASTNQESYHEQFLAQIRNKHTASDHTNFQSEDDKPDNGKTKNSQTGRLFEEDVNDEDTLFAGEEWDTSNKKSALEILRERMAKKDLKPVDHSQIDYISFRKDFYIEAPEVKHMPMGDISALRKDAEMKVRGREIPRPITKWEHCGLHEQVYKVLEKLKFNAPFAIQQQALPAIMSGRDVIGVAKTGSGKTAAYLIPMFRHIMDQPKVRECEGPIGLIMAPARELVAQIYSVARKFAKPLGLRVTAVYGGAAIAEQIASLKRGTEIVVCTPGRMIDVLTLNAGKVLSLERVTYLVLDEADRMFDMGFEPQIKRVIRNTRPDRQTVLFSATFPSHVEALARRILADPVEIVIGGRTKSSTDIEQHVEVRSQQTKFNRLLQLLGYWAAKGQTLIFVDTKERCDILFAELLRAGYMAVSLHGGKDQFDRDSTIADFKNGVKNVMVATSVAGRGLDVKDLNLVVNYNCPNHLEDYVHRVGRTGRAGMKGTAFTFITPEEGKYAPDLVRALKDADQDVPVELQKLADDHMGKVKRGEARKRQSGYTTAKGFRFDGSDLSEPLWQQLLDKLRFDVAQGNADAIELEKAEEEYNKWKEQQTSARESPAASGHTAGSSAADPKQLALLKAKAAAATAAAKAGMGSAEDVAALNRKIEQMDRGSKEPQSNAVSAETARMAAAAAAANIQAQLGLTGVDGNLKFEGEIDINEYPQKARWKVQTKEIDRYVTEYTGCAVSTRGVYVAPGKNPPPGERKLHLHIEGPTTTAVTMAKSELRRILEETTLQVGFDSEQYSTLPGF